MATRTKNSRKTTEQLKEYRRKRDFDASPEPAPDSAESGGDRFVVQEHSATRLHWDLRLERDGVAVSWAVPNGIPEVPGENRMAVHTEDHPLEYLTWEGVIPKGNYGAGTMKVWDAGTYQTHEWTDTKATVTFHGKRVEGKYHLFHIGGRDGNDWMIRRVDPPSDPDREPMPQHVVPLVAVPGPLPADDERHAYEIQWRGRRAVAFCEPGRLRLEDVAGGEITVFYPEVGRLTRAIGARPVVLDGELVALGEDGKPDPARLERRAKPGTESAMRRRARDIPVVYEIYDLLYLDGHSLMQLPWRERRDRLRELELEGEAWRTSQHHEGDGAALLEAARANGLPGIVAKPLDSAYAPGAGWVAVGATDEAPRVELTHADRVMYPKSGFTKGDMADYYRAVAPVLLPHVEGRPLSMRRYFHGVDGPKRWEKECPPQAPEWLTKVSVPSEAKGHPINYCVLDSEDALMWSVNHANIELHVTLALGEDIQRPTHVVFDLDPGEPADISDCAEVALLLRGMFDQLGLQSFAKTTGSKGLQVYLPLNCDISYEQTKPFARQVAELLAERWPERVTANMAKRDRRGKVLVDWSQNEWHKSTVAAYSLRARERPTVSTPVTWDEVEAGELEFDHADVVRRIEAHGDLFAPVLRLVQSLPG
ncbi:MAG TPA: non-homologous end-joining DNA ligase [Thermoleophilaceae bacterium]|nr:non-homologous end-joining DNA ligase [Thermoleophilaceae bacterium]